MKSTARRAHPASIPLWLIVALAVPRLVRILYPSVWVEDDVFLESAFAVSKGLRPYLDVAHPQMPLLEWVAGLYIQLVGASHVKMEVLNGAAIYATSFRDSTPPARQRVAGRARRTRLPSRAPDRALHALAAPH